MIKLDLSKRLFTSDGEMELRIECELPLGKLTAIFGQSGAGKTTLLRILAGLVEPDFGCVEVAGSIWYERARGKRAAHKNLPPQMREIGFVFQDYALFPNMTVEQNLRFALPRGGDAARVNELLELTELTPLARQKPCQLSGGQQQRVALARALIRRPKVLLLDEPFSALDSLMARRLQGELARIHRHFGLSSFLVSHSIAEVFSLADQVISLKRGGIEQIGSPHEVFLPDNPSGKFRTHGSILDIRQNGIIAIISVLVGNEVAQVSSDLTTAASLKIGDQVMLSSKAWNPLILRIN